MPESPPTQPPPETRAVLALAEGLVLTGHALGVPGLAVGEVCFNTSMTGYQEILTDPSYAGQLITFTFPHIGNVGTNDEDMEAAGPAARGVIVRAAVTDPSSFRAARHLDTWLKAHDLTGIAGVDTRRLTRLLRDGGPQAGALGAGAGNLDSSALIDQARAWPGLEGMDLAKDVSCTQAYEWNATRWHLGAGFGQQLAPKFHVVAVDYGAKRNILRSLADGGCRITVVPASASADDVLRHDPDGVFLSNGPGDPAATGVYAVPMIKTLLEKELPLFGICLGHQMLALALGAATSKMHMGHRGANHPVKDLATSKVEITSQNHGFVVDADTLPAGVRATHVSLFDGSLEGLAVEGKKIFSVQYHPEASPGPEDSQYLFERFVKMMEG
ncbi:MAG TPA: glutamine-hydrolyzing carbamoyl-phosphate synthase small subunit [Alphaproteobacteria bacterium]|nr:glutamine-hydrolyzing carbamoyl-phosphate synthase small subunit [Alphaproteobacteria bacterium]